MGIRRRRRRRLSTTLLQVDKRLRSLERRKAPKRLQPKAITKDELDPSVLDLSSQDVADTPNGTAAPDIPIVHKRIIFRARLSRRSRAIPSIYYIETDFAHELQEGDKVIISGVSEKFDGTHTVAGIQDPFQFSYTKEWDGDNSLANTSQVVTVINKQCTTTTATISFSGSFSNPFRVGDTIEVDGLGAPFDGVFVVASRPSTTSITYDFDAPQTAVSSTPTSGGAYPTALRYVVVGSTWRDSTNQNLYQWDGIKWVLVNAGVPDNVVIDDNLAPNPPTNLNGTSTAYFDGNIPRARVALTWDAPEFNTDSSLLTDLEGFEIFKRYDPGDDWELAGTSVTETFTVLNLLQNTLTYFMVRAKDITGNRSTDSGSFSLTTAVSSVAVIIPSTPTATTRLGTITVRWDGLDYLGNTLDTLPAFSHVEVHQSTTTGFTPSATTLVDRLTARGFYVAANLTYGTPYYFKFVAVDTAGNKTTGSAQATATTARLVDTDLVANTLSTWPFAGNVVSAGSLASGAINASTLFGPNVVVQTAIAANAIGADQIAAGSIVAGKIGANAVTANTVAANAITAGKIDANAVKADTIEAGAVTGDKIEANAINGKVITGATVRTSSSFPRVQMDATGLFVYNATPTEVVALRANGTATYSGSISITDGTRTISINPSALTNGIEISDTGTGFYGGAGLRVNTASGASWLSGDGLHLGPSVGSTEYALDISLGYLRVFAGVGKEVYLMSNGGVASNTRPVVVQGTLDVSNHLRVSNNANVSGNIVVQTNANVSGTLGVTGTTTLGTLNAGTTSVGGLTLGAQMNANSFAIININETRVGDGTSSDPSYTFTNSQTTGLYYDGDLNFVRQGTLQGYFSATGFVVPNGYRGVNPNANVTYSLGTTSLRWSSLWVTGGQITTSDERTKNSIEDSNLGLEFIETLRPVKYRMNQGSVEIVKDEETGKDAIDENGNIVAIRSPGVRPHYGFIAQEVKEAMDELGVDFAGWIKDELDNPDSNQSLRYDEFIAPAVKAIQELSQKIKDLEAEIETLKNE